jgi:hypothetical protein
VRRWSKKELGAAAAVAAIALLALWLRVRGLAFGLPDVYNPDETAIMSRALAFAKGDLNPHNFLYPTLYFYVLFGWIGLYFAAAWLIGAVPSVAAFQHSLFTDPTGIYLAGRALGVGCGVGAVVATWRLGERLGGRGAGLAAAAFLAVAPYAVRDAHYVKHDVPATFAVVLAMMAIAALWSQPAPSRKHAVIAGAACGVAASVHYYTVFLALPLALALAFANDGRRSPRDGLRLSVVAAGSALLAFLAGTPFLLAEPGTAWQDIVANRRIVMDRAVDATGGLFPSFGRYLRMLAVDAMGWPVVALAIAGTVVLARRSRSALTLLLAFPLAFLAFVSNTVPATRYLNPVLPFVAILAGTALAWAAQATTRRHGSAAGLAGAMLVVVTALPALRDSLHVGWFFRQSDTRTLAREHIERTTPAEVTVLLQPYSVPLRPSRASLVEALRHHLGDETRASVKFRLQLGLSPYPQPAYRVIWLGSGGQDVDKLYVDYGMLEGDSGRDQLDALGASLVVLKGGEGLTPDAAGLSDVLTRYARREAVFSPFRRGAAPDEQPFLHNTDTEITPGLARPGPVIEVWRWPPAPGRPAGESADPR